MTNSQGKRIGLKLAPGNQADITSMMEALENVRHKIKIKQKGYNYDKLHNHGFDKNDTFAFLPKKDQPWFVRHLKHFEEMECILENLLLPYSPTSRPMSRQNSALYFGIFSGRNDEC
ncbi:hypothetical protein AAFN60_04740 [Roseibacillus persicicus]|uniref:hypothetical protein n=1 Tax=Roseibacillus persicicus TaxID=454148 RepID=UPI00398AECE0